MNIYLSARFGRQEEMKAIREEILDSGHYCTSRWLDEKPGTSERDAALIDLKDIDESDCVVFFTETPDVGYTTGGRHVELGYAIANKKFIYLIGPRENVFYHHPRVEQVPDIHAIIDDIEII